MPSIDKLATSLPSSAFQTVTWPSSSPLATRLPDEEIANAVGSPAPIRCRSLRVSRSQSSTPSVSSGPETTSRLRSAETFPRSDGFGITTSAAFAAGTVSKRISRHLVMSLVLVSIHNVH